MPEMRVVLFGEHGRCPFMDWLADLPPKVQDKCIVRVDLLEEKGYELRRPMADSLRDGIHELRVDFQGIHYRILYFFAGQTAVISHGLKKEGSVPSKEIDLAVRRKREFEKAPDAHIYRE